MKGANRSDLQASVVFKDCISRSRDPKIQLVGPRIAQEIEERSSLYERLCQEASLNQFPMEQESHLGLSKDAFISIYENGMVKKSSPGRKHYDKIMACAPSGRCPFCGISSPATLDHFLPKSAYPSMSVAPCNLVPSCYECNMAKSNKTISQPEEVLFHPYFDSISDIEWLKADVIESHPLVIDYRVAYVEGICELMFRRLSSTFELLKLRTKYSINAASELSGIKQYLCLLVTNGGHSAVATYLKQMHMSRKVGSYNTWDAPMYQALSESDWFIEEGIMSIGS